MYGLFVYLLNHVSSSGYIAASNGMAIKERYIGKDVEGNGGGPVQGTIPLLAWTD
jgi:hypothetical protein